MKLTWLVLAFMAIIVHVTFGEITPRLVQSPRVKRESIIRHDSSPTAFDRSHSGIQTLASQSARYVRRARPDPLVIALHPIATVTVGVSEATSAFTDGTGTPTKDVIATLTPEQRDATFNLLGPLTKGQDSTFASYELLRGKFMKLETSPPIPANTDVFCQGAGVDEICTTSDGVPVPVYNVDCEQGETCRTIDLLPEEKSGLSEDEMRCMEAVDEYLRLERVTERQLQAAFNVLTNKANGARRRRQIESFSGGRSGTPSGFRSQPVKRSAGPHNLRGQGRALQRK